MGQVVDYINAEVLWIILLVAITQWNAAGAPAAAFGTAGQPADGVEKLVRGIGFPTGRFTAPSYNDAGTIGPHP